MVTRGLRLRALVTSALLICGSGATVAQAAPAPVPERSQVTVSAPQDAARYGLSPQWVQLPYLHKDGKRFVLKGSVIADMYRTKTNGSKKADTFKVRVRVAKPGKVRTKTRRDVGLLPVHLLTGSAVKRLHPSTGEVTKFAVTLPPKVSRDLAQVGPKKRRAAVVVSLDQRKDTSRKAARGLIQIVPGPIARGKFSNHKIAMRTKSARKKLRRVHHGQAATTAGRLAGTIGNEPWYNQIIVSNGSPFVQQVNVNPNIQCMWTGANPNSNVATSVANVYPGAQVWFSYPYQSGASDQPGLAGATSGLNAPGTQGQMLQDLVQAGVAAGQKALGDLGDPETYGEGGVMAAVGGIVIDFGASILKDALQGTSSCDEVSTYPELFGVTTTVTGFGWNNAGTAENGLYSAPEWWSALPDGTQYSNIPGAGGSQAPTQAWLQNNFASMLGAQTSVVYYWNGGQAAPMVSNNAGSGSYTGGVASFQGGLFQFAGANPGTPSTVSYYSSASPYPQTSSPIWSSTYEKCMFGDNTSDYHYACTMNDGSVNIQLGMLNNPLSNGGLWIGSTAGPAQPPSPIVSATGSQQDGYSINCQIPNTPENTMQATFQVPFAPNGNTTELQGGALTSAVINGNQDQPSDAYYTITYYATTADGEFVYFDGSVDSPGANGIYQPYLAPNASQAQVYINNPSISQGTISPDDLDQMVTWDGPGSTPQAVAADDIAYFGCNVTASLNLQGLDITNPALSFGTAWPMPDGSAGGWPNSVPLSSYNFSWMTPVNQLNVTFQSMPVGASLPVSQITPPSN